MSVSKLNFVNFLVHTQNKHRLKIFILFCDTYNKKFRNVNLSLLYIPDYTRYNFHVYPQQHL